MLAPYSPGGPATDKDFRDSKDHVGQLRESWSWSVQNDSYRRYEVFLTIRGASGLPHYSIVRPTAELVGGDCSPIRWTLPSTAARQGHDWTVLRYTADYGGVGNWTLNLGAEGGVFQYDLRVSIDYY